MPAHQTWLLSRNDWLDQSLTPNPDSHNAYSHQTAWGRCQASRRLKAGESGIQAGSIGPWVVSLPHPRKPAERLVKLEEAWPINACNAEEALQLNLPNPCVPPLDYDRPQNVSKATRFTVSGLETATHGTPSPQTPCLVKHGFDISS